MLSSQVGALEFGTAVAIKHTIPGDINYVSEAESFQLIESKGIGRGRGK